MALQDSDSKYTITLRKTLVGHTKPVQKKSWSADGTLIATPSADRTVRIWDIRTGNQVAELKHPGRVFCCAWSGDCETIATGGADGHIRFWSVPTGEECLVKDLNGKMVLTLVHNETTDQFAWGTQNGQVGICDANGESTVSMSRFSEQFMINSLVWSIDGKKLFAGCGDNLLRVWNATTGECNDVWAGHTGAAVTLSLSPDGSSIASGSHDGTIRIWDSDSGIVRRTLEGHTDRLSSVAFSSNGDLLASKATDGTLRIWKTDDWWQVDQTAELTNNWGAGIAFHPSMNSLASSCDEDRSVRIWKIEKSESASNRMLHTTDYTCAKIVLVGESNVGKSCLAMRLAEDRYPDDHEHGTTHGMRFWPMEAEELHPAAKPPEGQRRDVVLWDFGGQDEYQLVHQMFLNDTTLALVLIDQTRGRGAGLE